MTLFSFKKHLKLALLILSLVIYGAFFYIIGKIPFSLPKFFNTIKVVSTEKADNTLERPLPYVDSQSGEVISSYVKLCSNTSYGFEVAYPRDWFTTYDIDDQKCAFFAPFSFVIHSNTDSNFVPIKIESVKVEDWLQTVKFYTNPNDFQNIIADQNIQLSGRGVHRIKSISTGAGAVPKGFQKVVYLVFDASNPLIFSYQQQNEKDDVASFEKILEEIVSSLKYF